MDKPEHPLKHKIRTASTLKLVSATLGMTIINVAILSPLQRFIEALVSYTSVATNLYIMIFNFVGLGLLFLLSGTRIKWTEPKENTLETQTSLPLKEVCELFSVFTAYYLLMLYLFFNIEFILQYHFPLDHTF